MLTAFARFAVDLNSTPPARDCTETAAEPSVTEVPASLTTVIVCDVPASACNLIQSAASSLAVITALPPSAHRSFPSAQASPMPPATALRRIEPAASLPSVVPAVLITEYSSLPAVPCGAMICSTPPFRPILTVCPSTTLMSIEPADESKLIAPAASISIPPAESIFRFSRRRVCHRVSTLGE